MDKMTFASYKFKASDVIEGLNRYFAESKVFLCKVPLEIKNGTVKPGNYYVFRNIVFNAYVPKIKELGYYYLICDPEEIVGVAINWLREEHDIFYTPGMEAPFEDFDVDEAAKEYEKATRKDLKEALQEENKKLKKKVAEQQKKIDSYEATLSKITDIMEPKYAGPTWSETWDDMVERIKRMKEKVETLEAENADWMNSFKKAQDSRSAFCKKLKEALNVDYRYPGSFPKMEEDILAEVARLKAEHDDARGLSLKIDDLEESIAEKDIHIEGLEADRYLSKRIVKEQREFITKVAELLKTKDPYIESEYEAVINVLSNIIRHPNLHRWRYNDLKNEILKVYREIFDCSNGDPEGSDEETMQDILTEYKRCLELKDVAEEKTIKYKELAIEKAVKYKKLTRELDRYKWLYENLKNGVESVLQEAEEKED